MQNSFRHRWRDATSLIEGGFALLQRGRSPSARERAKGARRLPLSQHTFPPIAQAMGAVKSFFGSFFSKKEQKIPQRRTFLI